MPCFCEPYILNDVYQDITSSIFLYEINIHIHMTILNSLYFENLVFEGGGIKGVAYVGSLKVLNKLDKMKYVKKTIGTSVGSIFALLVSMKCTDDQIDKHFWNLLNEMTKFNDNVFTEAENIISKMGLHSNENMYTAVNSVIKDICGTDNTTFEQLYELTKTELTVVATCLSTRKIEYFNHLTYPNMEVAKSIQISTSVPLFYTVTKWNNMIWADGGIVENFPIEYYDIDGAFNEHTLGFMFEYEAEKHKLYNVNNLLELFGGIENTFLDNNIRQSIGKSKDRFIIDIDSGDVSSLDFNISQEKIDYLMNQGTKSTMDFFSENYEDTNVSIESNKSSNNDDNIESVKNNDNIESAKSNDNIENIESIEPIHTSVDGGFIDKVYKLLGNLKFW